MYRKASKNIELLVFAATQGSLDALQLSLAIILAMAAVSGMVQPYLLPQAWSISWWSSLQVQMFLWWTDIALKVTVLPGKSTTSMAISNSCLYVYQAG